MIPRVIFPDGFDERAAFEMTNKGWLSAEVEMSDGTRVPVYFSDPVRLEQDLDEEARSGRHYLAQPGLIVLREVTVDAVEQAVRDLGSHGFFSHLRPCDARGENHGS